MQLGVVILAPLLAGPGGIEITQARGFHPVRLLQPMQRAFHDELALAIRAARDDALGFGDGNAFRLVKEIRGRRQDEFLQTVRSHGLHEIKTVIRVILQILERLLHRLAHERAGGEVHHGLQFVFGDGGANLRFDRQIALHEQNTALGGTAARWP